MMTPAHVAIVNERLLDFLTVRRYPAIGLALARVTYGACILLVLATNAPSWRALWGVGSVYSYDDMATDLRRNHSLTVFSLFDSNIWVAFVLIASVLVGISFMIGYQTRLSTILLTILFWSLSQRDPLITDGGDNLVTIALAIMCLGSTAERLSVDSWIRMRRRRNRAVPAPGPDPRSLFTIVSNLAWIALVVQICILYSTSGLAKVQGGLWQQGTALYYILRSSEFMQWPALSQMALRSGILLTTASYIVVLIQVFFPLLIVNRVLKMPTICFVIVMHAGIGVLMGLPIFALIMTGTEMILISDRFWTRMGRVLRWPTSLREFEATSIHAHLQAASVPGMDRAPTNTPDRPG